MKHTSQIYAMLANGLRFLAVDAVEKAKSGHPGMPLGMADIISVLWLDFIQLAPANHAWSDRDRFILSNGHGSMLLYAINYLSGMGITLEDIKQFRQQGSVTAGHPEYELEKGIETTTGPLGQGLANAVGMAMALIGQNPSIKVYCTVGDGCLMEGISQEVCSLAGTWRLRNLIVIWDDNAISIDGPVEGWFTENVPSRFLAMGWHVITDVNGHDYADIYRAFKEAEKANQPVFIQFKTTIGKGLVGLEGTSRVHGAPAGAESIRKMRELLKWPYEPFEMPQEMEKIRQLMHQRWAGNGKDCIAPRDTLKFTAGFWALLDQASGQSMATRAASKWVLDHVAEGIPNLVVGSADLTASNLTKWQDATVFGPNHYQGRYVYYGVREFGMFGIANGLALAGKIAAVGTFLTFMDYGRSSMRMAAMMNLPVVYVLTHDSIGLGEDGPTHQPIEHLAICRLTPNLTLWRPCSLLETAVAWEQSLAGGPHVLSLSRQNLPVVQHINSHKEEIEKGAYVLYQTDAQPKVVILASGSEAAMVFSWIHSLEAIASVRIVSCPSLDRLYQQPRAYRDQLLGQCGLKVVVEAASSMPWYRWVADAWMMTCEDFGESAPYEQIYRAKGITLERLTQYLEKYQLEVE